MEADVAYMINANNASVQLLRKDLNNTKREIDLILKAAHEHTKEEIQKFRQEIKSMISEHLAYI